MGYGDHGDRLAAQRDVVNDRRRRQGAQDVLRIPLRVARLLQGKESIDRLIEPRKIEIPNALEPIHFDAVAQTLQPSATALTGSTEEQFPPQLPAVIA